MDNELTDEEIRRILDFKNDMHEHPEISHAEIKTTAKIEAFLGTIPGVKILDFGLPTGVIAEIDGAEPGKTIGLRCDIDALRQHEEYDNPHHSRDDNADHACGHDFHTASMLGAAMILSKHREEMKGKAVLLFQPAEETTDGMHEVLAAGFLERVKPDAFFAIHNWPEVPAGKIVVHRGAIMGAKTNFQLTVHGRHSHGSMPQFGRDAVACSAAMITALQGVVSRHINPLDSAVLTVGAIHGGTSENITCDEVVMKASIRTLSDTAMTDAVSWMETIVKSTAASYGCTADIDYREKLPLTYNGPEMSDIAERAAEAAVGRENVVDAVPTLASEDFSLMMAEVPSFMYWIGSGTEGETPYPIHHAKFHTNDTAIPGAASVLAQSVFVSQENASD